MLWVGAAIALASVVKWAINDAPAKAVEVKRMRKVAKKRSHLPKKMRDAKLITPKVVLTDREIEKLYKCPRGCMKKINEGEYRAELMEKTGMIEKTGLGKKCKVCKHTHPV